MYGRVANDQSGPRQRRQLSRILWQTHHGRNHTTRRSRQQALNSTHPQHPNLTERRRILQPRRRNPPSHPPEAGLHRRHLRPFSHHPLARTLNHHTRLHMALHRHTSSRPLRGRLVFTNKHHVRQRCILRGRTATACSGLTA